jgi:hypothetical protein
MGWLDIPLGGGAVYEVASPSSMLDSWLSGRAAVAGQAVTAPIRGAASSAGEAAAASAAPVLREALRAETERQRSETVAAVWRTALGLGAVGLGVYVLYRYLRGAR